MASHRAADLASLVDAPLPDQSFVRCTCFGVMHNVPVAQLYVAAHSVAAELKLTEHGPAHFQKQVNALLGRTRLCCLAFAATSASFAHRWATAAALSTVPIRAKPSWKSP